MQKYTLAQILEAWAAAYGEDMQEEYPGFIQRLSEENASQASNPGKGNEQKTWKSNAKNLHRALALARGPGPELQATSRKLQAPSCKLDKTAVQCYCIL